MASPQPLLVTRELRIGYPAKSGSKIVADGIEFRLDGGEFICLLGPNGAGKSTLLRTLAGIQPPLKGTVSIGGGDVGTLDASVRAKRLGLVLTDRIDAGNLTVRDLTALGRAPYTGWLGRLSAEDEARVEWALRATGSEAHAARKVAELSDGERQKAMIARVLAQDTPVIILDEPTAHLDLPNRVAIMRLLRNLARETRRAIILSTHELDLALQAADAIWLMDPGGKMLCGIPEDMVLSGAFESVFARGGAGFDKETGTFRFHEPGREGIELVGSGPFAFWTRRALERSGFRMADPGVAHGKVRLLEAADGSCTWISDWQGITRRHASVQDLIRALTSPFRDQVEA
jgi:iron complex transport system ATP-binding protein